MQHKYHRQGCVTMKQNVEDRAAMLGEYIVENKATVRRAAAGIIQPLQRALHGLQFLYTRFNFIQPGLHYAFRFLAGVMFRIDADR